MRAWTIVLVPWSCATNRTVDCPSPPHPLCWWFVSGRREKEGVECAQRDRFTYVVLETDAKREDGARVRDLDLRVSRTARRRRSPTSGGFMRSTSSQELGGEIRSGHVATRLTFVKGALLSMFAAIPLARELMVPRAAGASSATASSAPGAASGAPGDRLMYVDCVDQPCQWMQLGGECWCHGGQGWFCAGPKWGCIDPVTGTLCKCACYSPGCTCRFGVYPCQT